MWTCKKCGGKIITIETIASDYELDKNGEMIYRVPESPYGTYTNICVKKKKKSKYGSKYLKKIAEWREI